MICLWFSKVNRLLISHERTGKEYFIFLTQQNNAIISKESFLSDKRKICKYEGNLIKQLCFSQYVLFS